MNTTNILTIILFLLIGWYIYLNNNQESSNIKEGFKISKKLKKSLKGATKSVKKAVGMKSGSKPKAASCELDTLNLAILQVIKKTADQTTVPDLTSTYSSGLKTYMEDALKTNLQLTEAGSGMPEDELQVKVDEAIKIIRTKKSQSEFTKWFSKFVIVASPPESETDGAEAQVSESSE